MMEMIVKEMILLAIQNVNNKMNQLRLSCLLFVHIEEFWFSILEAFIQMFKIHRNMVESEF